METWRCDWLIKAKQKRNIQMPFIFHFIKWFRSSRNLTRNISKTIKEKTKKMKIFIWQKRKPISTAFYAFTKYKYSQSRCPMMQPLLNHHWTLPLKIIATATYWSTHNTLAFQKRDTSCISLNRAGIQVLEVTYTETKLGWTRFSIRVS